MWESKERDRERRLGEERKRKGKWAGPVRGKE